MASPKVFLNSCGVSQSISAWYSFCAFRIWSCPLLSSLPSSIFISPVESSVWLLLFLLSALGCYPCANMFLQIICNHKGEFQGLRCVQTRITMRVIAFRQSVLG